MRIIAGAWRGRRLIAPAGMATRPTADRARETLFSMLTSRLGGFTGLAVADLYAGSGALGLEAMSRGAASCLFVDQAPAAQAALRANIETLGASHCRIEPRPVERLMAPPVPFDLILLDPPYGQEDHGALIDRLTDPLWLAPGGMIALETERSETVSAASALPVADRIVGKAKLHLFRRTG